MSLEQELKLAVMQSEPLELTTLTVLTDLLSEASDDNQYVSTYFDTPEMDLMRSGVGLRMRLAQGQWMQTVKTSGTVVDGLHQRQEWEHLLAQPEWNLDLLHETALKPLIDNEAVWTNVDELFTTDFMRQTMQLVMADGSEIELAYDCGHVRCGEQREPIHEVELELKSGDVNQLSLLAEVLCEQLPLTPSNVSKAQQGYELVKKVRA